MQFRHFLIGFRISIGARRCRLIIIRLLINCFRSKKEVLIIRLVVNSSFNICLKGNKFQQWKLTACLMRNGKPKTLNKIK